MSDEPNFGSYNEIMSVEAGEQNLSMKAQGMSMGYGIGSEANLTFERAAEYYWNILIEPLQH